MLFLFANNLISGFYNYYMTDIDFINLCIKIKQINIIKIKLTFFRIFLNFVNDFLLKAQKPNNANEVSKGGICHKILLNILYKIYTTI